MKKENNYNEIGDANIIIIDAKEEFSYSKSLQFKKRLFSSLSTYKTSNELLELYKPVKKFKPLSTKNKLYNFDNALSSLNYAPKVSDFSLKSKKEKKQILSTEEMILEEYKKHKFKAMPLSKSLFSHLKKNNFKGHINKTYTKKKIAKSQTVKNKSFTATPLPSFNVMEVKKSEKLLTVAKSPKLHTKARSLQRQRQNEAEEIKRILSFKLEQ